MILGCWTFSSITDEQISSIKTWYYPTIYFNWSIHYWTVGTGFVDVSPDAILWYNYQLMTKSKHDMNFTIFGVNSPQFSMDLPTANIINTPHPPTPHFSVNYTFHNCWVNNEPKNVVIKQFHQQIWFWLNWKSFDINSWSFNLTEAGFINYNECGRLY